jgi:F-box and leucine-rich repeat protein 2/20
VIKRNIRLSQILVIASHRDKVSDLTFEAVGINCYPASCDEEVKDDSILSTWEGRKYVQTIDLSSCGGITDIGLSALCYRCDQLQTIDFEDC